MELNDAPVLDQLRDHWQKVCGMLLWKMGARGKPIVITKKDLEEIAGSPPMVIFTHGRSDALEFKLVTIEEARRIAEYQKTLSGRA